MKVFSYVLTLVLGVILGMAILQSENSRLRAMIDENGILLAQPMAGVTKDSIVVSEAVVTTVPVGKVGFISAPIVGEEHMAILAWVTNGQDGLVKVFVPNWKAIGNEPPKYWNGRVLMAIDKKEKPR